MAEREVTKAGQSTSAVTYGGHQNAKDDGIDVRVTLASGAIDGYVPCLATGFQAKAEHFGPAEIKKEMRPKGKLRESIRAVGEARGAYIIVSSKGSVADPGWRSRKKAMSEAVADEPSAIPLYVDFYDKQRIASWVNQHPGIVAWVRDRIGQPISGWRPFRDWSSLPSAEDAQYVLDSGVRLIGAHQNDDGLNVEEGIDRLRAILGSPKGVVRLVGLSGVGKTRLVQALFDDRIGTSALGRHLAVYTDLADGPDPVPAELLSRLQSSNQQCILIIDNCGAALHRTLTTRLLPDSPISLLTIEYDISDDAPENTDVFKLEPASKETIEKVLRPKFTNLTSPELHTIADFSEGNFRVALALANTSQHGESLANLKDTDLFNRLFRQKNEDNPALLRAAKICSLVYSFDADTMEGSQSELPLLAALAGQPVSELHEHVAELKRRQLIQARSRWRALLPHALAHRLAKLALEDIPPADVKKFVEAAPERLLKSLSRRLGCLHDHPPAQKIVREWLAVDGMLSDVAKLNKLGMVILNNIAPVLPEAVLSSIAMAESQSKNLLEGSSVEELVRLLRSLAYEPLLFDISVAVIARFARCKTESNNMSDAVNVFKSLFYLVLSGTHAPAKQRADFLRRLAGKATPEDDELTLAAFDAMLECTHFSSSYSFEFGTRRRNFGFRPATWDDQYNWYREVFSLARDLAELPSLRDRVRMRIASQFVFLARRVRLDDLLSLSEEFASSGGWAEGWVGVRAALSEAKAANLAENESKLASLETKLAPSSLADRIVSFVVPEQWGRLDVADLDIDDDQRFVKAQKNVDAACEQIGFELADDLDMLRQFLPVLLDASTGRVATVARSIGRRTLNSAKLGT